MDSGNGNGNNHSNNNSFNGSASGQFRSSAWGNGVVNPMNGAASGNNGQSSEFSFSMSANTADPSASKPHVPTFAEKSRPNSQHANGSAAWTSADDFPALPGSSRSSTSNGPASASSFMQNLASSSQVHHQSMLAGSAAEKSYSKVSASFKNALNSGGTVHSRQQSFSSSFSPAPANESGIADILNMQAKMPQNMDEAFPSLHSAFNNNNNSNDGLTPSNASASQMGNQHHQHSNNQHQHHQHSLHQQSVVNQSGGHRQPFQNQFSKDGLAMNDAYGLLGLLGVIRMTDQDLNTLSLGSDLSSLGLNLNSSEPLSSTFISPWSNRHHLDFILPGCYNAQTSPPVQMKIHSFSEETLFYIFYSKPRDAMQEAVAQELFSRHWKFHKELKLWFIKDPNVELAAKTLTLERGSFLFFDVSRWEKVKKDHVIMLEQVIDEKNCNAHHANADSSFSDAAAMKIGARSDR